MVRAVAISLSSYRLCHSKGGIALVLQVGRVVVVEGELFREVPGQLALRVELGQSCGAGLLPGAGVLVVGNVERVYGLAGQEPSVLALLGHAPAHRGDPARFVQHPQHLQPVLCHAQDGRQVGHAGQGHPGDYPEESSLFLVQWSPPHYRRPPLSGASIPAQAGVGLPAGWPGRLSRRCGQRLEGEYPNLRYSI